MNLQIIKSIDGKAEYVLLPFDIYQSLQAEIKEKLNITVDKEDYVSFDPADYVDNPVALARIKAGLTQEKLAKKMKVSQAYISKLESQADVTAKVLQKVMNALAKRK